MCVLGRLVDCFWGIWMVGIIASRAPRGVIALLPPKELYLRLRICWPPPLKRLLAERERPNYSLPGRDVEERQQFGWSDSWHCAHTPDVLCAI